MWREYIPRKDNLKVHMSNNPRNELGAKKKKILYVITKSNWGGSQRYVYDLAHALRETCHVAVAAGGEGLLIKKLREAGIATHAVPSFERDVHLTKEFHVLRELLDILRTEMPDIVHVNSSKAGGLGALAVRIHNLIHNTSARSIFTAHGWAFKEDRPLPEQLLIRFFSYLTVLLSHATIVVSEDDRRRASWMPFVGSKIHHIWNGIDTEHPLLTRDESRASITKTIGHEPAHRIWVGTIAELHRNKGLLHAIRAIEELRQDNVFVSYVIIGEGEERHNIETLLKMKGLRDTVLLTGTIADAAALIPAFDIFLLPSTKEGLPYTILEAGVAGVPVVATAVGGIPEIIEDMRSGILVRSKNSTEIAGAIRLCVEDAAEREVFGKALFERVRRLFTLPLMVEATERLYRDLTRPRRVRQQHEKTLPFSS